MDIRQQLMDELRGSEMAEVDKTLLLRVLDLATDDALSGFVTLVRSKSFGWEYILENLRQKQTHFSHKGSEKDWNNTFTQEGDQLEKVFADMPSE